MFNLLELPLPVLDLLLVGFAHFGMGFELAFAILIICDRHQLLRQRGMLVSPLLKLVELVANLAKLVENDKSTVGVGVRLRLAVLCVLTEKRHVLWCQYFAKVEPHVRELGDLVNRLTLLTRWLLGCCMEHSRA